MKKIISWITIASVGLVALLLIGSLFEFISLKGAVASIIFTALTFTVAGILTLNSCNMLEQKNKLAIASLSLIGLSTLLVVLCFWTKLDNNSDVFLNLTLTISILSVCFNLITSGVLKLGKRYMPLQIISYICYGFVSIYFIVSFWGSKSVDLDGKVIALSIILSLLFFCIQVIVSKKQVSDNNVSTSYVKIKKEEYEELLACKKELERVKLKKEND